MSKLYHFDVQLIKQKTMKYFNSSFETNFAAISQYSLALRRYFARLSESSNSTYFYQLLQPQKN